MSKKESKFLKEEEVTLLKVKFIKKINEDIITSVKKSLETLIQLKQNNLIHSENKSSLNERISEHSKNIKNLQSDKIKIQTTICEITSKLNQNDKEFSSNIKKEYQSLKGRNFFISRSKPK